MLVTVASKNIETAVDSVAQQGTHCDVRRHCEHKFFDLWGAVAYCTKMCDSEVAVLFAIFFHGGVEMPDPKFDKVVEVVNQVETGVGEVSQTLETLKEKLVRGEKITADDLELTVTHVNRIDALVRDRADVGH